MKITNVVGSPRTRGNGAAVATALINILKQHGASAQTFELNTMVYRGCQACYACKTTSDVCVVNDGLTPLLAAIRATDAVILSAPVYMSTINAQVKGLCDRLYSLLKPDFRTNPDASRLAPGKKLALIVTQGNPDEKAFGDVAAQCTGMFGRLGFKEIYPIRVCGAGQGEDIRISEKVMEEVREAGKGMMGD